MINYNASSGATLTLTNGDATTKVDLYSTEGLEMLANLWIKAAAQHRLMYEPTWLGRPIIQFPTDIVMMQELIWKLQPDVIVETGVAHGGSLILSASICELLGKGKVIGVDIEVRPHNREAIEAHPLSRRVQLFEGSSVDPAIVSKVREECRNAKVVLVVLDSNHTESHVAQELAAYHSFVTEGSYIVVHDGAQAWVSDIPRGKPEWAQDNPLGAIHSFLVEHPEFEVDPTYNRMLITSSPQGFLRRKRLGDK